MINNLTVYTCLSIQKATCFRGYGDLEAFERDIDDEDDDDDLDREYDGIVERDFNDDMTDLSMFCCQFLSPKL